MGGDGSGRKPDILKSIKRQAEQRTPIATEIFLPNYSVVDAKESGIDHNNLTNTHNLTTDIDHNTITNNHNLTTDINHNTILNNHNLTTDIDHNSITNTHNLTTDIDHNTITNNHNLTTDIDHDQLTNFTATEHFTEASIDHTNITNIGTNTHAQIDTHIADTTDPHSVISTIYPVGSLYISTNSTNPATVLGIGTWATFGAGKVLVGLDSGDTDFDTSEETGGSKTHTLTTTEMPAHTHTYDKMDAKNRNFPALGTSMSTGDGTYTSTASGSTGGGGAHNNVQPYIVVYMFKRTA